MAPAVGSNESLSPRAASDKVVSPDSIPLLVIGESPVTRAGLAAAASAAGNFVVIGSTTRAGAVEWLEQTGHTAAPAAVLMEGGTFLNWAVVSPSPRPASPGELTAREVDVLRLLAEGASNKIIAHRLGISDHTAKFHVGSILSKLNAGSRTEAVTLGVRMGLVYL